MTSPLPPACQDSTEELYLEEYAHAALKRLRLCREATEK